MRLITMTKLLMLGGAVALVLGKRRSKPGRSARASGDAEPAVIPDSFDLDPQDPVQQFEDVQVVHLEDLDVDALSNEDARAAQDLIGVGAEIDEAMLGAGEEELPPELAAIPHAKTGSGDLYGVHLPTAVDRKIPDNDSSFDEGQNWLEALEASATEHGPEPEQELDIVDEDDLSTPSTDTRDRPIADLGSAGPRGM
ncbi:MAG: hypothetical protein H6Q90_1146 [Deltaproteobacteria bacterium]|nr:hypothetical protein [Deltaproteobacteria bacterium]